MKEYSKLVFKDRHNSDSLKWDALEEQFGSADLFPAWVADMDIESPECVRKALSEYVDYNVHGYYKIPQSYFDAFIDWMKRYHGYEVQKEWLRFAPGVVPAIYWLVQILTRVDDAVAIMPPVYYPFGAAIRNTARTIVDVPLINQNGRYTMDLERFEEKVARKNIRLFILCSPHNPAGRVWTEEELRAVLDICRKHGVYVISDEIHHDLVLGGRKHVTAATVGEYDGLLVTLTSASKTFNLAGCQNATVIIPNQAIRSKFDGFVRKLGFRNGSNFGYVAYQAAFREGREWLEELLSLIEDNFTLLKEGLKRELPDAVLTPLEGTYLAWIDLTAYLEGRNTERVMSETCGLALDLGEWFFNDDDEAGEYFVRVNLATSPENVLEVIRRLALIRG